MSGENTADILYEGKVLFYGENPCECIVAKTGKKCSNNAYYFYKGKVMCGMHSKKESRKKLPVNPNKNELKKKIIGRRTAKYR